MSVTRSTHAHHSFAFPLFWRNRIKAEFEILRMYFWCVTSRTTNETCRGLVGDIWPDLWSREIIFKFPRRRGKYVKNTYMFIQRMRSLAEERSEKKNGKRGKTVAFIIQRIYSRLCLYARGPRRDFFLYICMYVFLLFTFAKISFSYLCADLWYRTFLYVCALVMRDVTWTNVNI